MKEKIIKDIQRLEEILNAKESPLDELQKAHIIGEIAYANKALKYIDYYKIG